MTESTSSVVRTLLGHVRGAARANRRPDLESSLDAALRRLDRPGTVLLVAGEFKQGKSSLINALLGVAACPVDDDLATAAVTVVRYGEAVEVKVRRRSSGGAIVETILPEQLADVVSERGNPGNHLGVEVVEIALPNALLERGWTFVDTPGIGGLNPAQAAAALGFLPLADALLFVTDASAELSANELEFMQRARETCPIVLVGLSKIDLFPAWRSIERADLGHLGDAATAAPVFPVSAALRVEALTRADGELNRESGVPRLLEVLQTDVLERAERGAVGRVIEDGRRAIRQLRLPLEREAAALRDPAATAALEADLKVARDRVQHLRGPGARWGQRLNDGFSELAASVDYRFRAAMRATLRRADEAIEAADPADRWDAMAAQLQAEVARAVGDVSAQLVEGAAAIREEVAAIVRDEVIAAGQEHDRTIDVGELWSGKPITRSPVQAVGLGFGALRGAQSGVLLLGMLGNLFGLALVGPVLIGGAAVFAGKSIVDERKRQLGQRRQEARTVARQYVDDVGFEVGTRIRDMLRDLQREIREDTATRLEELQRTYVEAAAALEGNARQEAAARQARVTQLDAELRALADLEARLARLATAAVAAGAT